jgi:hypothetical protein
MFLFFLLFTKLKQNQKKNKRKHKKAWVYIFNCHLDEEETKGLGTLGTLGTLENYREKTKMKKMNFTSGFLMSPMSPKSPEMSFILFSKPFYVSFFLLLQNSNKIKKRLGYIF